MASNLYSLIQGAVTAVAVSPFRFCPRGIVETDPYTRYAFYIDGSSDLCYRKSVDRGMTWSSKTVIHAATYEQFDVWFDRWTPGDSGTKVHIWGNESGADNINYFSLDTSTDTLGNSGTAIVVFDGASSSLVVSAIVSGAKSRGGNLLVIFDIDGGTETGCARSTDGGANWSSRASPVEASGADLAQLFPGNESDNQDMWCVYWDTSANELSLKVYDDSADSWAETSIATSMNDVGLNTVSSQFSGVIRPSDNHLLLAAWNARDSATADLQTWDINGAGSITAKTDVHTNVDDCQTVALSVDPDGKIHAAYIGKGDGSQTVSTAVSIYKKVSADGMATWGSELAVFDKYTFQCLALEGPMLSKSNTPTFAWTMENHDGRTDDDFVGAWPGQYSVRPQSLVGV